MSDDKPTYETAWTWMGLDPDSGYGPWRYQVFSSEEELREKLHLFANVETDATARVSSVTFQPCLNEDHRSQDRRVVQNWNLHNGRWTFVGVFDGHAGHETVDYAVAELPIKIKSDLEVLLQVTGSVYSPETISSLLAESISDFDKRLLGDLLTLFPGGFDGAVNLPSHQIEEIINDADFGGQNLKKVHRCKQGSTVLVSLVDPEGENLWVANLGDCEAVLGTKSPDGTWKATPLSSNHNGGNEAEVMRVRNEHPGEDECILRGRVLGAVAVTRALGDYLFKLPAVFTTSVLLCSQPATIQKSKRLEEWLSRNITPPYLSNRPDVLHHQFTGRKRDQEAGSVIPDKFLIMCSDGLTGVYPKENNNISHWAQTVGMAMEAGECPALALLWQALGGNVQTVSQYLTLESIDGWMDDTTIAVLTL